MAPAPVVQHSNLTRELSQKSSALWRQRLEYYFCDIHRLLSAAHDSDVVSRSFDTPSDSDVTSDRLAQTSMTCRISVHALADGLGA